MLFFDYLCDSTTLYTKWNSVVIMVDNRRINVDYVAVIRQEGNLFKLDCIDIKKPETLLTDLKEILENPECTLLDLQSRMCEFYNEDRRRTQSYLFEGLYTNPHVLGHVSFPKIYSPDDLIQDSDETLKKRKKDYYHQCLSFITAITFNETIDECKKDPSIKLHSSASCGCRSNDLIVNPDIKLNVTAQLGYSLQSAYLGISLWYKNILIQPYSVFVSHFRKFIKYDWYIELISPHTRCWDDIFRYAVDMANMATTHPEQFYNKYIKDEIRKMISGLTYIIENPKYFIDSLIDDKESYFDNGIRPEYVKTYREFPDDMSIALIADKLSDAHELLSNLADLAAIEPAAKYAYETIEGYIKRMRPKIKECYIKNSQDIDKLKANVDDIRVKQQDLKEKKAIHTRNIEEEYDSQDRSKPVKCRSLIAAEYETSNYEYRYLLEEIKQTDRAISSLLDSQFIRNQILPSLQQFLDTIKD